MKRFADSKSAALATVAELKSQNLVVPARAAGQQPPPPPNPKAPKQPSGGESGKKAGAAAAAAAAAAAGGGAPRPPFTGLKPGEARALLKEEKLFDADSRSAPWCYKAATMAGCDGSCGKKHGWPDFLSVLASPKGHAVQETEAYININGASTSRGGKRKAI